MPSTTTYSRGEVVYVPFRFTERETSKNRPAVVVSSPEYHGSRQDVIIAGITSNLARSDFVGFVAISDWQSSGLARPSAVSGIIMTVRDSKIGRRIGVLSASDKKRLDQALREAIGL